MGRKRDPSKWSESTRQRIERAYAKAEREGRDITYSEALGQGKKMPKEYEGRGKEYEWGQWNLERKKEVVDLKVMLGTMTPAKGRNAIKDIEIMQRHIDRVYVIPPYLPEYRRQQERLHKKYQKLVQYGLFPENSDERSKYDLVFYKP